MPDPNEPNIYDLLMGQDPGSTAQALAQRLRRQQAGQILGAPDIASTAGAMGQQAKQEQDLLEKAAVNRLHYGPERQQMLNELAMYKANLGAMGPLAMAKAAQAQAQAARAGAPVRGVNQFGEVYEQKPALPGTGPWAGAGGGGGGQGGTGSSVSAIADAIEAGQQPPDMKGMYRYAAPVKAELARRGFDLSRATNEWGAMQRNLATMNNAQQTRMRQSIDFAYHSLDNIESLYNKWQEIGSASGFRTFNKAALATSKQMPGEVGATATALEAAINDMVEALGNVYMGGNTPTDEAFKLAKSNLSGDWNPETFKKGLDLARKNLSYRDNAIKHAGPVGTGGQNRYFQPAAESPTGAATPPASPAGPQRAMSKSGKPMIQVNGQWVYE
jgi:hypothetical protein